MAFRARVRRIGTVLTPHWYPFIGNFVALAKSHMKNEKDGLGKHPLAMLPFNLEVYVDNETKRLPETIAVDANVGDGFVLFNKCQSLE